MNKPHPQEQQVKELLAELDKIINIMKEPAENAYATQPNTLQLYVTLFTLFKVTFESITELEQQVLQLQDDVMK